MKGYADLCISKISGRLYSDQTLTGSLVLILVRHSELFTF
jgi:hypothetical protein